MKIYDKQDDDDDGDDGDDGDTIWGGDESCQQCVRKATKWRLAVVAGDDDGDKQQYIPLQAS